MSKQPRILLYDLETSFVNCRLWRIGKQYVSHESIVEGSRTDIICLAYKWLGEKEVHTMDWGLKKQDSRKMVNAFSEIVATADLVVAQNGDNFDMKQLNTQRLLHGDTPILWPTSADTLKGLRKHFRLPSNKLDYVGKLLFKTGKNPMRMQDWIDVIEKKDPKALQKMLKYNIQDVLLLEKTFNRLRPWLLVKPLLPRTDTSECPSCYSTRSKSKGRRVVRNKPYQRRVCRACGHTFLGARITDPE